MLIVPNRGDVDRVQRELLAEGGALLAGRSKRSTASFPARSGKRRQPRRARRASGRSSSAASCGVGPTARRLGPVPGLCRHARGDVGGARGRSRRARRGRRRPGRALRPYRAELDRLGVRDRDGERRYGADRAARDLRWTGSPSSLRLRGSHGRPVGADRVVAARVDVTVHSHTSPGRIAFEALERTSADLARIADGRIEDSVLRRIALLGRSSRTSSATSTSTSHLPPRRSKALCGSSRLRAPVGCSS